MKLKSPVRLNSYIPRAPKIFETARDQEIFDNAGGTLVFDSEIFINYFLTAFKDVQTKKVFWIETPHDQAKLHWILHNYRVIGFNSYKFDLPVNSLAIQTQDTARIKTAVSDLIIGGMNRRNFASAYCPIITPDAIDLIEVCPLEGSLKLYGARIHTSRIQEMPTAHDAILTPEEIVHTRDYCINDLDNTEDIFHFCRERLELRYALSARYGEDLRSKSDAQMAETVLRKEVRKLTRKKIEKREYVGHRFDYKPPAYLRYSTPAMQAAFAEVCSHNFIVGEKGYVEKFENEVKIGEGVYSYGIGGLHSQEETICYRANEEWSLDDHDATSFYPRIITTLELYPESVGPAFLNVFTGFIDERVAAKKAKNFTTDKGLKIFINGTSGKFSDPYSTFYDPTKTVAMTLTGQFSLLMLIEWLELSGVKVISANTDGIVLRVHKTQKDLTASIITYWEKETSFTTEETNYSVYAARDVNAYFAVKLDGSVKVKGPWSEVGSQSGTQLDTNPASLVVTDAISAFLAKGTPVEETVHACTDIRRLITVKNVRGGAHKNGNYLGKVVRWYYAKGVEGTINYVLTNNKVPGTEGAKPLMDMDGLPSDVDYDWYVRKAIEGLYEIGAKRRLTLFDMICDKDDVE